MLLSAALLAIVAVTAAAVGDRLLGNPWSASGSPADGSPWGGSPVVESPAAPAPPGVLPREEGAAVGEADGILPEGTTPADDHLPGVAGLDAALLDALREAAADAADDGVTFTVASGWRSRAYQDQLLREAVAEHGSEEEAARWVASADTSAHVSGDAVDIGPAAAREWLSGHGAAYGLCQVYGNEPWHYELRPEAVGHRCPRMYADPTEDPRLQD